ncbi:hypothetical protein TPDSL_13680 [Terrisporobacter petrolearius]
MDDIEKTKNNIIELIKGINNIKVLESIYYFILGKISR